MKRLPSSACGPAAPADPAFSHAVIAWQKRHGRHALPWQNTRDPYRIWLSEIMLQQTQVAAVIPYYQRFLARFPDLAALAAAPADQVMAHWSGLGYYLRARNLHRCAQRVCAEYGGVFPSDPALLADLPGIGRSTAAAIAAFAHGARAAIMDGNVKRVFCRVFGIEGYPGARPVEDLLWRQAQALLPERDMEAYTQGLMDLGATVCTRGKPDCPACPLAPRCAALASDRVARLPAKKPAKPVPQRHAAMLVLVDRGQVLLEQRPGSGIWGGLLSLPELAAEAGVAVPAERIAAAVAPFGSLDTCQALPAFSHAFTHFKLHVTPYRITLERRAALVEEGGHTWRDIATLDQAPLPAPVKKLLLGLALPLFK